MQRLLSSNEVVEAHHWVRWSPSHDAWTNLDRLSPFIGLPVETLRHRHGQPELQFGELKSR